jgi:hypothetical protein
MRFQLLEIGVGVLTLPVRSIGRGSSLMVCVVPRNPLFERITAMRE